MSKPAALPRFEFALRVYWEDTDAGGVVFYANYLKFFERARTEWLRSLGFEQQRLKDEQGAMFIVTETNTRHLRPARLDDLLRVSVALPADPDRGATLRLFQQARRGFDKREIRHAEAELIHDYRRFARQAERHARCSGQHVATKRDQGRQTGGIFYPWRIPGCRGRNR